MRNSYPIIFCFVDCLLSCFPLKYYCYHLLCRGQWNPADFLSFKKKEMDGNIMIDFICLALQQ